MGRVNQAMRRARQAGLVMEFEPVAVSAYDASVLSAEPFPAEGVQEPVAPAAPKTETVSLNSDRAIQDVFFNTYPEKVWRGQSNELFRLNSLLAKIERHAR